MTDAMTPAFFRCVGRILLNEGGATITDDPNDPGGLTRYGISQRAYPDVDIRNLTQDQAVAIYHRDYWLPMHCDEMPEGLALVVFDTAVNQGLSRAARLLQRAVAVTVDGEIGPNTLRAAQRVPDVVARFTAERLLTYAGTKGFETYGRGWFRRAISTALETHA